MAADNSYSRATPLRAYVNVLKRRKWWLIGAIAVTLAGALAWTLLTPARYLATAQLTYNKQLDVATALVGSSSIVSMAVDVQRELDTYANLMTSDEMAKRAADVLGVPVGSDFGAEVTAAALEDTAILRINAESDDAETAKNVANAYATGFQRSRLEATVNAYENAIAIMKEQLAQYDTEASRSSLEFLDLAGRLEDLKILRSAATGNFVIAAPATLPLRPFSPNHARDLLLGLFVGVLAGLILVSVVEQLDVRVHSADEIGSALDLPVLARVPRAAGNGSSDATPVTLADPAGPSAEAYRIFRGNLEFADIGGSVRALMVSSAVQGEGKSVTAANLGVAAALGGKRVIVVDADLRRASLHRLFALNNGVGLSTVLTGRTSLSEALHTVVLPATGNEAPGVRQGLAVLTSGPLPPNPGEIAASQRLADVITSLNDLADLVIVDAPPFLVVGDAGALSRAVDGVVVVARLGSLTRAVAHDSREFLATLPCRVLGVAVIGIPAESAAYRYKYYSKRADEAGDEATSEAPPAVRT